LTRRGRRELPAGLGGPADDPATPPDLAGPEVAWLEPLPDRLVDDPAVIVAARDSLRLALIASLQYLPARQRAVLLLREVLAFPAAEVATMLDMSTAGVKSMLQRARARLGDVSPGEVVEPTAPEARALLDRYIAAFENADAEELGRLLRADAVLEGPPSRTWFAGRATCVPYLVTQVLGEQGDWRLLPTSANGQPAVVGYHRGRAFGVGVLTYVGAEITRITVFGDPALVARFGLPDTLPV
jgi:RNA polymerase sigma-70 factor (ECF subfamily)